MYIYTEWLGMGERMKKKRTILSGPSAGFGPLHFPFVVFISFVPHKDGNKVRTCQSPCIGEPPGKIRKRIPTA